MAKRKKKRNTVKALHVLQPNAAGIDIGATERYVAVPENRSPEAVRHFGTFTEDLHQAAQWLQECNIESIASGSNIFILLDCYEVPFGPIKTFALCVLYSVTGIPWLKPPQVISSTFRSL